MSKDNQPDWDTLAEKFDLWLPHIAPVGEALLQRLNIQPGDRVLDVASGTGEPAISLAQRHPHAEITGIDAAAGMVRAATNKQKKLNLANLRFQHMPAEHMQFDEHSFDALVCRFGVMLFEDSQQGLKEMHRVLKPGGQFALAVWGRPEAVTSFYWGHQAFKGKLPEADAPPLAKATSLGTPELLSEILHKAGFSQFTIDTCSVEYRFNSFAEYWHLLEASDVIKQQLDALSHSQHNAVRNEIARFAADFHGPDGLVIPHEYLVASGHK